jgi:hypothetical protein
VITLRAVLYKIDASRCEYTPVLAERPLRQAPASLRRAKVSKKVDEASPPSARLLSINSFQLAYRGLRVIVEI